MAGILTAHTCNNPTQAEAAKILIASTGPIDPRKLKPAHALEINAAIASKTWAESTKRLRANSVRQILGWLTRNFGAPDIAPMIKRYAPARPRNVTVTDSERAWLLGLAEPHIKLWLLLCSDLAMRSGTAMLIGPQHYDKERAEFRFITKAQATLTLPATREIFEIVNELNGFDPYVQQLWDANPKHRQHRSPLADHGYQMRREFRRLCKRCGITRGIRPHDLRRTTAVKVLEATGDLRDVQAALGHKNLVSTLHYLDHDLRPVRRSLLETIKRPAWAERKQA